MRRGHKWISLHFITSFLKLKDLGIWSQLILSNTFFPPANWENVLSNTAYLGFFLLEIYNLCSISVKLPVFANVIFKTSVKRQAVFSELSVWTLAAGQVNLSVCVLFQDLARSRMDSQPGWWLSLVMQADSLMTVLTPEHTNQWASGTLADVHTPYDKCTYVWYMVWRFLKKTPGPAKMKEKEICWCMTLEKITRKV